MITLWQLLREHAAGQDILGLNSHQIQLRDSSPFIEEAIGLT